MPKLTYWVARCTNDSEVYSIRTKTKRECLRRFEETKTDHRVGYEPPKKVTVEYRDAFDLMDQCSCEDRGYWET